MSFVVSIIDAVAYCYLHRRVALELNLTYDITVCPYTSLSSGLLGPFNQKFESGNFDVLLHHVNEYHGKQNGVSLTPPFMVKGFRAAMKKQPMSLDLLFFLKPFQVETWLIFLALLILFSATLTFISLVYDRWIPDSAEEVFSLRQSLWYFWSFFTQIGSDLRPISLPGNMLTSAWSCFTIIFMATYTANLAAVFSATLSKRPLQSIGEIQASAHRIFTIKHYEEIMRMMEVSIFEHLFTENRVETFPNNYLNESRLMMRDNLAKGWICILPELEFEYQIPPDQYHNYYLLEGAFNRILYSFALRQGWNLTEKINNVFFKYGRNGVFEEIFRNYLGDANTWTDIPSIAVEANRYYAVIVVMVFIAVCSCLYPLGLVFIQRLQQRTGIVPNQQGT